MLTKGVLFHQDSAPVHEPLVAMHAISNCEFELVDHLPILLNWLPQTINSSPTCKKNELEAVLR